MNENLIQLWLMLSHTLREDRDVAIFERTDFDAIRSKLDGMLNDVGISPKERETYSLEYRQRSRSRFYPGRRHRT